MSSSDNGKTKAETDFNGIRILPEDIIPGESIIANIWRVCIRLNIGCVPKADGSDILIPPDLLVAMLSPSVAGKTVKNTMLNGVPRRCGGLVSYAEATSLGATHASSGAAPR